MVVSRVDNSGLRGERGIREEAQCADCRLSGDREKANVFVNFVEALLQMT